MLVDSEAHRRAHLGDALGQLTRDYDGRWTVRAGESEHKAFVHPSGDGWQVELDGRAVAIAGTLRPGDRMIDLIVDGEPMAVQVRRKRQTLVLSHGGAELAVEVLRPRIAELRRLMPEKVGADMTRFLLSPMPGLLVSLSVEEGEPVKAGQPLAVIEAMKMENVLRAERDGTVKTLHAGPGDSLSVDQAIIEFE